MLTFEEAEARHIALKRRMRQIQRAIRNNDVSPELDRELAELIAEVKCLSRTLKHSRQMFDFLLDVHPYGPPQ